MSRRVLVLVVMAILTAVLSGVGGEEPHAAADTARFVDVPEGHLFGSAIEWMADQGITRGCNPPANDKFCPDARVTRGQMAAFLSRLMFYRDGAGSDRFSDDDSSIFESAIERLAEAGVTKGCNPPGNDRFCPDDPVTRGQMAAFLVRASALTDDGGGNSFVDDDGSVFEADIAKLAAAGITLGCNPPDNDRFCPNSFVTRGQMATFMWRAVGEPSVGEPGINRIDPEQTLLPDVDDVEFVTLDLLGASTLRLDGKVDVGDVIVLGITDQTPYGFLGGVTSVTGDLVTTQPASLMDAIPQAEFDISIVGSQIEPVAGVGQRQLATDGLEGVDNPAGISLPVYKGFDCDGAPMTIDTTLNFDFGANVKARWDWFRLEHFRIDWNLIANGEVDIEAGPRASARHCLRFRARRSTR